MDKRLCFAFVMVIFSYGKMSTANGCVDSTIKINGKNCSEYVGEDECNCKKTVSGLPVTTLCCASCEMANTDDCCKDRLSAENNLTLSGGTVLTSCDQVRADYQFLCKQNFFNAELGLCCDTCADLGDCLNENIIFNNEYNCAEFVAKDRCNCVETVGDTVVETACCDACKDVDTTGCDCRDKLSDTNTVSYTVTYSNGTTVSYTFTSCTDLVDKAPQLCSSVRNNKCCDSCKGVCVDNPFFRATLKNKKNGKKCRKCSCSKIRKFNKKVAKKACRKNQKKVADNCCDMCKEFL